MYFSLNFKDISVLIPKDCTNLKHYFTPSLRCFCKHGGEQNLLLLYSNGTFPLISAPQRKQRTKTGVANPAVDIFASNLRSAANAL